MSVLVPSETAYRFSPYNWHLSAGAAKTICAGAYWRTAFTSSGTGTLTALFDASAMPSVRRSRVGFRVDGGPWQDFDVQSEIFLTMPSNNTWAVHTVEMVVIGTTQGSNRWASPQAPAVVFLGLRSEATITARQIEARGLYGVAFGDSITEGIQVLSSNLDLPNDVERSDARLAWSWPLTELLGAEVGVIGFGAAGLTRPGNGGVPAFPESASSQWQGQARDWTNPRAPDFIAAHLGTNDIAASDAEVAEAARLLLDQWISATPATTKIVVFPNWLQRKTAALSTGISQCAAPSRVTLVNTTGWWSATDSPDSLHPYGYVNLTTLAPRAAASIRSALAGVPPSPPANAFICGPDGTPLPIITG